MKNKFLLVATFLLAQLGAMASSITYNGSINLDFTDLPNGTYTIYRAEGRFANFVQIAQTNQKTYVDNNLGGKSPYTYYYKVQNGGNVVAELSMDVALFGPNVKMYSPADDRAAIAAEIKNIDDQLFHDQFSEKRYAEVFKPGDYRDAGKFNIPYYVQIMGLGQIPTDVKIYNIECPPALDNNNATCNFWRAMENLSVLKNGDGNWLLWSVSQAAPMRRIYTDRFTDYDWRGEGWASGGFTADCYFADKVGTYSQQQWYTRNSHLDKGDISNGNGGWNIAYQGITLGNGVNANHFKDNWEGKAQGSTWGFVSGEENTPVIREKPFLFLGDDGRYKLFRPALRRNAVGPSWTLNNMGEGTTYDVVNDCFVAKPETPVATINAQLAAGKHVIFTPGLYVLNQPIRVTQPNTIVLGIGLPTLIPGEQNDNAALIVGDIDGATVAGFMFDTYYSSESLLKVGEITSHISHAENPTLLADCFFRIGGFANRKNNIDISLQIKSNDVIGDHFWIWRADHGAGVGWDMNTARNGLVVYGDRVHVYCLCNEHFQQYQTLWKGEDGKMFFYQCETPYDPQNQADYESHNGVAEGFAAYKVANGVKNHYASMLGIYDVFINTNGALINIQNSIEVPAGADSVHIHNACNVRISTLGGLNYVVNETQPSTANLAEAIGQRFFVVDYYGSDSDLVWEYDEVAPLGKEVDDPNAIIIGEVNINTLERPEPQPEDTENPTQPGNLRSTNVTDNSISIAWDASTDNNRIGSYKIYINDELVASVGGTVLEYTINNLAAETNYNIQVSAVDPSQNESTRANLNVQTTEEDPGNDPGNNPEQGVSSNILLNKASSSNVDVQNAGGATSNANDGNINSRWESLHGVDDVTLTFDLNGSYDIDSVYIKWENARAKTYSIEISDNGNTWTSIKDFTSATSAVENSFNTNVTASYLRVKCIERQMNYGYSIYEIEAYGKVAAPKPEPDTENPTTPGNLEATSTTNSVSLNWTASNDNEGVTGYNIYQGNTLVGTTTNTNYTIDGLEDNTTYNFSVEAFDAAGNVSAKANVTKATVKLPDTTRPTTPGNLEATSTTNSVSLNWTASTDNEGVTGYNIYQGNTLVGTTTNTNYTIDGLEDNTTYNFSVEAFDAAGNASIKATVTQATVKLPDTTKPTAPSNLTATSSDQSIGLNWTASTDNEGVAGYNIYVNGTLVGNTTNTNYTISNLDENTSYQVSVEAYDAAGNTSNRTTITKSTTLTPDTTAPTNPGNLTANATHNSVSLNWSASTDNTGVAGYNIYQNNVLIGTTINTNYNITNLNASTAYKFDVEAFDVAGNVSGKTTINKTTESAPDTTSPTTPGNLNATATDSSVSLSWSASSDNTGVIGYNIYQNGYLIGSTPNTNYTIEDLTSESSYTFEVEAVDGSGNTSEKASITKVTEKTLDTTAPTKPGNLTATSTENTISLNWSAATDNEGVAGYNVYLNGEKVTTTNTSYEFTDLEPNTSYTIEVEAVDATGNVSGKTTTTINTKAEEVIAPEPSEPEDNPTAVSESSISIIVYPNPVTDELHINTNIGNYTVELKDMNGRQLMFEANTSTINMSDYATGIYLIQINDGEKISNLKIIKR